MKGREDVKLALVFYAGMVLFFGAGVVYARVSTRSDAPWTRDFGYLAFIAFQCQAAITFLIAREAPPGRRKTGGYLLSLASLGAMLLAPWLLIRA